MAWSWRWSIAVAVVVLSFSDGGSGKGTCPEDVLSTASHCFPSYISSGLVSNFTSIQRHCRSGMFTKSLACLTQVEAGCRGNKKKLLLLHSFIDVNRWKASLDELCSNVHILQESAACWAVTTQKSARCIQMEMLELKNWMLKNSPGPAKGKKRPRSSSKSSKSSSSSSRASSSSTYTVSASSVSGDSATVEESLENLKHFCNTSRGILDCFKPMVHKLCSREAALLLEGTYLAFQPPLCVPKVTSPDDDTDPPDQGGSASGKSLSAILYLSCVTVSAAAALRAGFF